MNYENIKNQLDGVEKVVDVEWLGTGDNEWDDICVVLDQWIEMNGNNSVVKKMIMEEYGFDNDDKYQDFINDKSDFYDWFCDNTETNRIMYMNSKF